MDAHNKPYGFISVCDNVIKNIYSSNENFLIDLLKEVMQDMIIQPSIVTKLYEDLYQRCGLKINRLDAYKHFVMIRGEENE